MKGMFWTAFKDNGIIIKWHISYSEMLFKYFKIILKGQ